MRRNVAYRLSLFVAVPLLLVVVFMMVTAGSAMADDPNPLGIDSATVLPSQQTDVSIILTQTTGTIYSFDLTITYNPSVISFVNDANGSATSGWFVSVNSNTPGTLLIGMAGGTGLTTGGEILVLTFEGASTAGSTPLTFTRGELNEGAVPVTLVNGTIVVNTPPTAYDDNYSVDEDNTLTVPADGVLTNDGDIDGHALTATLLTGPSHGVAALKADGSLTYTPTANYNGPDSLAYLAADVYGASDTATVNITVNAVNDAPEADAGGPYSVDEGSTVALDGSASTDVDDITGLTYEWDLDGDGTYETTGVAPVFDASSLDGPSQVTLSLRVSDPGGETSAADTATVNILNVVPTADAGGPYSVTVGDSTTLDGSGSSDPVGAADPLTYAWDLDDNGTFESSGVSPTFDSTGLPVGPVTVSLKVTDDDGGESTVVTAQVSVVARKHDITGQVTFWHDSSPVSDVALALTGSSTRNLNNASDGSFELLDIPEGSCTLTPSKSSETNGITAYDAALVLQHVTEAVTLSGYAAVAADANEMDGISGLDASLILRRSVDLIPLPFSTDGPVWVFNPSNYSYTPLAADMANQDIVAVLLGDVSGNWDTTVATAEVVPAYRAQSLLDQTQDLSTNRIHLTLHAPTITSVPSVYSLEVTLVYPAGSAEFVSGKALQSGWAMAVNAEQQSMLKVAFASAEAADLREPVAELILRNTGDDKSFGVYMLKLAVNEVQVQVREVLSLPCVYR